MHVLSFHFCTLSIFNSFLPLQPSIYFNLGMKCTVGINVCFFKIVTVCLAKTLNTVTTWKNNFLHLFGLLWICKICPSLWEPWVVSCCPYWHFMIPSPTLHSRELLWQLCLLLMKKNLPLLFSRDMQTDLHSRVGEAFLVQCVPQMEVVKPPAPNFENTVFNW